MKLSNITKIFVVVAVFAMLMAACAPAAEAPVAEAPAAEAPAEAPAAEEPAAEAAFGQADCAPNCTYADMVMCYPQLGAESDWRTANTASSNQKLKN
jgi:simple sugar transport system substrate-binding protein